MKKINKIHLSIFIALSLFSASAVSYCDHKKESDAEMFTGLQTEAAKIVIAFNKAIETGDAKTAINLLSKDVLILEGNNIERSAEQYACKHLLSDINYLAEMRKNIIEHHVSEYEEVAISISRNTLKGTHKGKLVDRVGNETITLRKFDDEWKISHIHWSH